LRIIAGKYGGLHLLSFDNKHIRPTTDREKESIFNILQNHIDSARVLDLFSGTGSLGLEALSRGAAFVQFVDFHVQSIKLIKDNIKKLKISEDHQVLKADVIKFLKTYEGPAFEIILIDPPFTKTMAQEVMMGLKDSKVHTEGTLVCIETGKSEKLDSEYGFLKTKSVKAFKDKHLYIFVH
jgi:16S rRNA (guanine966-N2)-methyltransferase